MPTLDDFVTDIARSGLMSKSELDEALAPLLGKPEAPSPSKFARALIEQQRLTSYQARKLLGGATRGFFLGGYRLLRPLGEGGMGKVFLARKDDTGDLVAIKVLPPKRAAGEKQALPRFRREMELSRRATHPNLARTLDVGNDGDVYFMVLEYVRGESLYHAVKGEGRGPLRVTDAARLFLKVIDGLEAAHAAGLIHRDIKPSNIMVTPEGDARLLDLGLARATDDEAPPLTRPNLVVGTLDYASPEQLVNASAADRRSDLYSLGCTLYFTLAGRPPFDGGDIVNKIFKQRMEDPQPLERVSRGVPAAFGAVVRKLMAKDPDERYQDCAELRADLVRWTDPARLRAILGAEAESARAFRLPAPDLDDFDLRLLADPSSASQEISLRDLGTAEPTGARYRRPVPGPLSAILRPPQSPAQGEDSRWLGRFIAVVVILGLVAILAITVLG